MTQNQTINTIDILFKAICDAHIQINGRYSFGPDLDLSSNELDYPRIQIIPGNVSIRRNTNVHTLTIMCIDIAKQDDNTMIKHILSDSHQVLLDIVKFIKDYNGDPAWFDIINNPVSTPVLEDYRDRFTGYAMTLELEVDTTGPCDVPIFDPIICGYIANNYVIPTGPTGPAGIQGPQGFQGDQGFKGDQGPQGEQGEQGFQGNQGPQGEQGEQGDQGFQGNIGSAGLQGSQGNIGSAGLQGSQGNSGSTGLQGFQGNIGSTGSQGNIGSTGFQGNIGSIGTQGNAGFQGNTGPQGFQGSGSTGSQGNSGSTGLQGSTGPQGFQGQIGVISIRTYVGTTDTLVIGDTNNMVIGNTSSNSVITVPPNSTVAFPTGSQVLIYQSNTGQITIAAGAGVTINSYVSAVKLVDRYAQAMLTKLGTDLWALEGNLTL